MASPGTFVVAPLWLFERASGTAVKIFGLLASYGTYTDDEYRECRPSVATLVTRSGLSRATVHRALEELIKLGAVTRSAQRKPDGSTAPSMYRLAIEPPSLTSETPSEVQTLTHETPPRLTSDIPPVSLVTHNLEPNTQMDQNPLSATPTVGAQLELISFEPPLVAEVVKVDSGGSIVRDWLGWMSANDGPKLPNGTIARYGRAVKEALAEGFDPDLIRRALGAMTRDRVASRPSLFTAYMVRVQQGPELPPERMSRAEASRQRLGGGLSPAELADWLATPTRGAIA